MQNYVDDVLKRLQGLLVLSPVSLSLAFDFILTVDVMVGWAWLT